MRVQISMTKTLLISFFLLTQSVSVFAQPEAKKPSPEEEFAVNYFEALKQKAIENYDKAIVSLDKCLKVQPNDENVFYQLGKNYLAQKNYEQAYQNFEKASKINPKNQWFWVGLYDVCYEKKDYNQAIVIVEKLITFDTKFKEDLVSLYMNTGQFDKALSLINDLNDKVGATDKRDLYKADILKDAKYQGSEKDNLLKEIQNNPTVEQHYLDLILLYSKSGQEEKALEIAKKLEQNIPTSDWAQVSLFKFHLNNKDGAKAVKSMNIVLESNKIDPKIKHRVLNEFLIFVKTNPTFQPDLDKAIGYFKNDSEVKVPKELGKFYQKQKDYPNAIKYYEQHFVENSDADLQTSLLLFECYTLNLQFDILAQKAEKLIDIFPSEPYVYYYAGMANNQLKNYKKAKDLLEMGLDYLVEGVDLEINFNIQLGESYSGLGNIAKKEFYFIKAEKLLEKQKK
jgi:tetratricopeptide (TPR) repeat protein